MSINVFEEKMISLNEARKLLPKSPRNKSISLATFYRWIQRGLRAKNGAHVKLEVVKLGGSTFTSQEAIQRFVDQLSACPNDSGAASSMHELYSATGQPLRGFGERPRTPLQQQRHNEWVNERLDELLGVRKCEMCKRKVSYLNKAIPKKEKLYCPLCVVKIPGATMGQRLRTFRWDANISQDELAKTTGIQITEIRAFEHGTKAPSNGQLQSLVKELGEELVAGMNEMPCSR